MPLRMRLIASIGLVLLVSLAADCALLTWRAAGRVQTELRAALDVGANTVRNGYDDLAGTSDPAAALRHLIRTFNGNRHVRATLFDAFGTTAATSALMVPRQPAPHWFRWLIGGQPPAIRLPVPSAIDRGRLILLQTDPTNEITEVWAEAREAILVLAGFAVLSAVLLRTMVGRALRSLETLSTAFGQISNDDYYSLLPVRGPPELARLADGFNRMALRLAAVAAQNHRLNQRLLTLQAEERADLARDLHDEIGPLLFSVDMTAATVERLAASGREADIPAQARSIHEAVSRMQQSVRAILERLRPLGTIGLATAIRRLVAFWQGRRPDIDFAVSLSIEEDRLGDELKETIYRVIQEGLGNAIRHGRPARVEIAVGHDDANAVRVVVTDNGIGMPADSATARAPARFGLLGMRERVMAMAGSLTIERGLEGNGVRLVAHLPRVGLVEPDDLDAIP